MELNLELVSVRFSDLIFTHYTIMFPLIQKYTNVNGLGNNCTRDLTNLRL